MKTIILFALAFTAGASANDTLGSMTTTGLVYDKSDKISMESEELYISPEKIRVKYIFKNDSDQPVKGMMVFPLPPIGPGDNLLHAPAYYEPGNSILLSGAFQFEVKVDGKKVNYDTEVKELSKACEDVKNCGIVVKFYWKQEFPPRKSMVVEHSYLANPSSGYSREANAKKELEKTYCIEKELKDALTKLESVDEVRGGKAYSLHYFSRYVDYILVTGANWKGPIKKFRLTIDKLSPDNLVSVCWDGIKKVSPTTFVSDKVDFKPTSDLKVYFVDKEYSKRLN